LTASKRRVIHRPVLVRGELTDVEDVDFQETVFTRAFDDGNIKRAGERCGEQREDVEAEAWES
jgi:hypothetical protein